MEEVLHKHQLLKQALSNATQGKLLVGQIRLENPLNYDQ